MYVCCMYVVCMYYRELAAMCDEDVSYAADLELVECLNRLDPKKASDPEFIGTHIHTCAHRHGNQE